MNQTGADVAGVSNLNKSFDGETDRTNRPLHTPRTRSALTNEVPAARIARLHGGFAQPGGRFRSTRAMAQRFAVSDRTAHRLLGEREPEGRLQRRTAAGSGVPGRRVTLRSVQRVFHPRAKRKGSFGARLLEWLESAFAAQGIA